MKSAGFSIQKSCSLLLSLTTYGEGSISSIRMRRKKWSELEEQTLLSKYSDLFNSGALTKLKTREKKFKPIADHVNSVHHLRNPINFPFRWSWRDVSIKVQNMRHQYLGVKQKIRSPDGDFHWNDGEHHWENFLKYKEVFGDVELEDKGKKFGDDSINFASEEEEQGALGLGFDSDDDLMDSDRESRDGLEDRDEVSGAKRRWKKKMKKKRKKGGFGGHWGRSKKLGALGAEVVEIRDAMLRREERRREREWSKEEDAMEREEKRREKKAMEERMSDLREEKMDMMESELQAIWGRKEVERRYRVERELAEERRRRMEVEEKWEEEEMAWREKMMGMQIEHEKQMAQMQAESCQNQNQILGIMARLLSQLFGGGGSTSDAAGLLPSQVLHNLQHHHHDKPETNSPSEFL